MTLKTSLNRGKQEFSQTYRWALKKNRGMAALLFLLSFMAYPMILLLSAPRWVEEATESVANAEAMKNAGNSFFSPSANQIMSQRFNSFLSVIIPLVTAILLLFALILCIQLFSYLHNKRSVDLFHSLPVGRTPMLLGRWCAGLTVLFVPILVNFLIAEITRLAYGITLKSVSVSPLVQVLLALLITAAAFTFSMFMAVCSGTTLDMVLSILGVNVGYPIMILCGMTVAGMMVPGLSFNYREYLLAITAFSPFSTAAVPLFMGTTTTMLFPVWWILLTLVLLAGSVVLYKKRKSETAENNFAFPIPKIIIRFLLTAVGGIGFGLILNSMTNGFLIGVVAGSVIAHTIVEAVYSRGFSHFKKSVKWYGVFAAAFLVFYMVLATGLFGYDTKVPNADEVDRVTVQADYINSRFAKQCNTLYDTEQRRITDISPILKDKKDIETVINTQKDIVSLYRAEGYPYHLKGTSGNFMTVSYHMKDGRILTRQYQYLSTRNANSSLSWDHLNQKLSAISDLPEYIKGIDMIFHVSPSDIKSVTVFSPSETRKGTTFVPDPSVKQEFVNALEQDMLNHKVNPGSVEDGAKEILNLSFDFQDELTPKDEFVKSQLNGHEKFMLLQGYYTFYTKDSATYQLIQKLGWSK